METEGNGGEFLYDAFISYRHIKPDKTIARYLHRMLESYRLPRSLKKEGAYQWKRKVFRDREELPTMSNLSKGIEEALRKSRSLIVICSPNTPES